MSDSVAIPSVVSKRWCDENLDHSRMSQFRKKVTTRAIRMAGRFTVQTVHEGEVRCEDGWLAFDARGYPYPIAADEFKRIYEEVGDADESEDAAYTRGQRDALELVHTHMQEMRERIGV